MTPELETTLSLDRQKELAALARMIAFTRRTALDLNVQLSSYCLGIAMDAVIEELRIAGVDTASISIVDENTQSSLYH